MDHLAYEDLMDITDPYVLGEMINTGTQTIAFKPSYFFRSESLDLENPVLIVTREKEKFSFLENLFGKNVVKKINIEDMTEEDQEYINFLEGEDWTLFFMEKMYSVDFHESDHMDLLNVLYDITGLLYEIPLKATEDRINALIYDIKEDLKRKRTERELDLEINKFENKIFKSIIHSLKSLLKFNCTSTFKLDLHSQQFVEYNKRIYCIDPVLFNHK